MTIKTITIKFDDKGDCISNTFIMLKDFDPKKELINFKTEYKHSDTLMCFEFVDYLLSNEFISKLPYNKTFVVSNHFIIDNDLYVGED